MYFGVGYLKFAEITFSKYILLFKFVMKGELVIRYVLISQIDKEKKKTGNNKIPT